MRSILAAREDLAALCDISLLEAELRARDVSLMSDGAVEDGLPVLVTKGGGAASHDLATLAERSGRSVLRLEPSWQDRRLRLSELFERMHDTRPLRLMSAQHAALFPTAVAAAVSGLGGTTTWERIRAAHVDRGFDPQSRRTIAAALGKAGGDPGDHGNVLIAKAGTASVWHGLLRGLRVVLLGAGGPDAPDLVFRADTLADLPDSIARALRAPAPPRDAARRFVAAEAMFNALPPQPEALADAIAESIEAASRLPAPRVSIVINNYNYARFLGAAIQSALSQTRAAHEVIVVDDGSTDDSRTVIAGFKDVIPVLKPNGGQASALNAGFRAASGDVVMFLDADDVLAPQAVAGVSRAPFHRIARVSFALDMIDANGGARGLYPASRVAAQGHLMGRVLSAGIFQFMPTSGNAFPRRVLERVLPLPEAEWRLCADLVLVLAAAAEGPALHLEDVLGSYRVHGRNGYFQAHGNAPYLNDVRVAQRRRAWEVIGGRLAAPSRSARDRARGHILRARAAQERGGGGLVPALAARLSARLDPGRSLRRPLHRGRLPGEDAAPRPSPEAVALLTTPDLALAGGRSTWPEVRSGALLDLVAIGPDQGALGAGWRLSGNSGSRAQSRAVSLGLKLNGPRRGWRIAIEHFVPDNVEGDVDIWVNGRRLERARVDRSGSIAILVPEEIPTYDREIGGYVACIVLDLSSSLVDALTITRLMARTLDPFGNAVPALREGTALEVTDEAAGAQALRDGWGWPGPHGATMQAQEAALAVAVPFTGDGHLWLDGSGTPPEVFWADTPIRSEPVTGGRGVSMSIPAEGLGDGGVLSLRLIAGAGGAEAPFTLRSLRADRTPPAHAGLLPGRALGVVDILREARAGWAGLAPGAAGAQVTQSTVTLPVDLPRTDTPATLSLAFVRQAGELPPAMARAAFAGTHVAVLLAGGAVLRLPVPAGSARTELLRLSFDALPVGVSLKEATLTPACQGSRIRANAPWTHLGATDLHEAATQRADWHLPMDDALWLGAASGALAITRPADAAGTLRVRVLTLPEPAQRLRLSLGDATADVVEPGPSEVVLPVPKGRAPLLLGVQTDMLVAPAALGVEADGLLGGAILSIVLDAGPETGIIDASTGKEET